MSANPWSDRRSPHTVRSAQLPERYQSPALLVPQHQPHAAEALQQRQPAGADQLGVVAQETTLDLELTIRENLLVYARYFDINVDRGTARHSVKANEFTFSFGYAIR